MKSIRDFRPILFLTAALAFVPMAAPAASFTAGNLAVESQATSTSTAITIFELSPATANQTAVNSFVVPITGTTALRQTDAGTSGLLSESSDGTLLCFTGYKDQTGMADETSINSRGVGTLNSAYAYTLQASYNNATGNGDQTRSVTTVNNTTFLIGDKLGIYTATASSSPTATAFSGNVRPLKSFGGIIYEVTANLTPFISTVSADGTTLASLPGITAADSKAVDFYMVSSANNGTYDILYILDQTSATVGAINKYALISGSWVAKSSYTTSFGGVGICAALTGSGGVYLYVTSGSGTTAANTVVRLTDASSQNANMSITTGNNVTLYTAASGTTLKGIAFAPVSYGVTYNGNNTTSGSVPTDSTAYAAGATVTVAANSGNLARTGYTFAGWNTAPDGSGTTYAAGSGTFTINANATLYAKWTPAATYTVTYNGNGNTGGNPPTDANSPYFSGTTVTVLDNTGNLTKTGFAFGGWNTAADGSGTTYSAANTFVISQNTTLYALWTQNPSITVSTGSLNFPPTVVNGTSASLSYTVSGVNLTANLSISAPAGFQISLSSSSGFGSSLSLTPSAGSVNNVPIFVQFDPIAQQGYSGSIANASTGATEQDVAVTGSGANAPSVSTQAATAITTGSASLNGTVTAANNATITDRGFYYQTMPGVTTSSTQADEGGTAVSAYTKAVTGLSANQIYYYRAYAVNAINTALGSEVIFYTLANVPVAPVVGSPTATTLNVTIGPSDGNSATTIYAIQETGSGKYVQATSGALGASVVFQTAAAWASQATVTGLAPGTAYTFQVKAQNGAGVNTAFGPAIKASTTALPFTAGDLAVLSPDNGAAADTTFSVLEISSSTLNQSSPVQTLAINGTVGTPGTALHMGTSATSGGLSASSDGTLLTFPGYNTTNSTGANTVLRGVGTLNSAGAFALPATYQGNGAAGNQTRSATTVDNQHFYWADKGGIYTNGTTARSDAQNVLRIKSFGGTVYVINQQGFASVVSIVSPDASTLYALPNYPAATDANVNDFYLISSGNNGSTYDIIYQLDATKATAGTIFKYSLVGGEWTANGSYTTPFGGCGICATTNGGGATLYVVTGLGTAANNSVEKLTDAAGYNATISITDNGKLYTAPGATSLKGVAFAPVSYTVTYAGNGNDGGTVPVDSTTYGADASVTELGNTGNLTKTGFVFAGWNTAANGGGANSLGGMDFAINSNTTFYAQWAPVNSPVTNTVEITSTVTYTVDPTQSPFSTIVPPYGYQWFHGSSPLTSQTGPTLTLANAQFADSGAYSVVVSNSTSSSPGISQLVAVLTVVDTHPPVLSLPANITVSTGSGGIQVNFNPTALDAGSGVVPVICSPPSGSFFSPGVTLVNCFASDAAGNTATGSFSVTVLDTNPTTNIVVNNRIYLPYSSNLAVGTWVWIDADPTNGSLMRATQRLLGEDEVMEKGIEFASLGFTQVTPTTSGQTVTYDYSAQSGKNSFTVGQLVDKFDPILIGPDGLAYITDGHHTMAAYLLTNSPIHDIIPGFHRVVIGQISENLLGQPGPIDDAWWLARQAENNAYLYGSNGDQLVFPGEPNYANSQPVLPSLVPMPTTPSEITNDGNIPMVNDDGRSLGWGVRQAVVPSAFNSGGPIVGYANTAPDGSAINFVDFFWADFFRNRVVWNNRLTPTGNGDTNAINAPLSFFAASANGIALGKSELYRDQNGRGLFDYTNLATYAGYFTNANTVAWANTAIGNGLAAAGDTYNLYLRDDSTIAGDIIPSAVSTNLLHIDTTNGMIVTQLVTNMNYLYINMGAQLTTIFPDVFVPNSTLTFPAGTGEVWLNDTAYVSTATVISNGICAVNGALSSPVVTVAHGSTLAGNGTINGAVTVQNSAALTPGNSTIGTLTVNGPLTLAGTTVMEINKTGTTLTGDLVTGVSTLAFGGTLTVNAGGDALVGGESFKLFSAGHYAGVFTATNLPPLAAGLHWDLSQLAQNGTIRVLGIGPVANTAYYTRADNLSLKIYLSDLLTNVTDANGFTVSFVGAGTDGLNNLTTNGTTLLNYGAFIGYTNSVTPNVNDSFEYTVSDGHGSTATGTVMIIMTNNLFGQTNVRLNVSSSDVTANFFGWPGFRYTVERSTNLTQGLGWVPISTNTAPANGLIQVIDNFHDLGIPIPPVPANAYYRLRYNP